MMVTPPQANCDGRLHFDGAGPDPAFLVSRARFTRGLFTLRFADYRCDNRAPGGRALGSLAALGLGAHQAGPWVRIERGQVGNDGGGRGRAGAGGGYLEVNWTTADDPGRIQVNWAPSELTAGWLQIRCDGGRVTFFYRAGPAEPWTQMLVRGREGQPVLGADRRPQPLVLEPRWPAEGATGWLSRSTLWNGLTPDRRLIS